MVAPLSVVVRWGRVAECSRWRACSAGACAVRGAPCPAVLLSWHPYCPTTMRRVTRSSVAPPAAAPAPVQLRRAATATTAAPVAASDSPAKRGRGRPRKADTHATSAAPAPTRGNKRTAAAADEHAAAAAAVAPPADDHTDTATSTPAGKRAKRIPGSSKKSGSTSSGPVAGAVSVPAAGFKFGTLNRAFEHSLLTEAGSDPAAPTTLLVGVDEAGRGPLAGPVVCAAVHVPADVSIVGVYDSKAMSADERERVFTALTTHPRVQYAIAILEHDEIDRINILEATMKGMSTATRQLAAQLPAPPALVLVDGNRLPRDIVPPAQFVIRGDSKAYCIGAASILAKVTRDRIMDAHHARWPHYGFLSHKGYGVSAHMAAIHRYGPCPIHRQSFAPMKHIKPKTTAAHDDEAATAAAAAGPVSAAPPPPDGRAQRAHARATRS